MPTSERRACSILSKPVKGKEPVARGGGRGRRRTGGPPGGRARFGNYEPRQGLRQGTDPAGSVRAIREALSSSSAASECQSSASSAGVSSSASSASVHRSSVLELPLDRPGRVGYHAARQRLGFG